MYSPDRQEAVIAIPYKNLFLLMGSTKSMLHGSGNDVLRISVRADLVVALLTPGHLLPVILSPVEQLHDGQKRWPSV